jgi:AcrR family transcriptional regulator
VSYSAAQLRTIAVAFDLFSEHGVSATSLQMIADALGVTKAAVYHQFKTKEEIALGVAEVELDRLERVVEAAEGEEPGLAAREVLLTRAIALSVDRPRMVHLLQNDPVMVRFVATHEPFRQLMDRLFAVLIGDDPGPEARVQTAMVSAALAGAVVHPLVAGLDDDMLEAQLILLARRLFGAP